MGLKGRKDPKILLEKSEQLIVAYLVGYFLDKGISLAQFTSPYSFVVETLATWGMECQCQNRENGDGTRISPIVLQIQAIRPLYVRETPAGLG